MTILKTKLMSKIIDKYSIFSKDEIDYIDKYTSLYYNLLMFALFYHFVHLFCFFGLIISYENYFCEKVIFFLFSRIYHFQIIYFTILTS